MTLIVKNVKPEDENIFPYAAITSTANQIISQLYRIIVLPSKSIAFQSLLLLSDKGLGCFCFRFFFFLIGNFSNKPAWVEDAALSSLMSKQLCFYKFLCVFEIILCFLRCCCFELGKQGSFMEGCGSHDLYTKVKVSLCRKITIQTANDYLINLF